jgi:hypothetical protein
MDTVKTLVGLMVLLLLAGCTVAFDPPLPQLPCPPYTRCHYGQGHGGNNQPDGNN